MSFLPKYLAVAVVGSVAVYIAAPFARPFLFAEEEQSPSAADDTAPQWDYSEALQSGGGDAVLTGESAGQPSAMPVRRAPKAPRAPNAATPAQTAANPGGGEAPEVIVENVRGYTPSTERIRPSGNDVAYWGVTIVDAPFYDHNGKLRDDKLAGGTLIEQTGAKNSSKGEMAICRIWRKSGWAGSYLVSTADLIRFDGGREEVDADDVENLCMYYNFNAAVERRKEELVRKAASANPHYAELKRKATAYKEHQKRAEELTAQRDQAKGAARSNIIAELTKLKNAEAREAAEVQALTRRYEDWKKSHPSVSGADPSADPVCRGFIDKMNELKPKLAVFGI